MSCSIFPRRHGRAYGLNDFWFPICICNIQKRRSFYSIYLRLRTWRADLEVLHRIVGLFNKVHLFSRLTKEGSIAIYLFSRWVYEFRRRAGWRNTGLYIKASATCLMRYYYYRGSFDRSEALPHPISLTRCGLPRNIPAFHRKMIRRRDNKADQ